MLQYNMAREIVNSQPSNYGAGGKKIWMLLRGNVLMEDEKNASFNFNLKV